ncbi:MAG TPA: integrase arm-type DNA-binding domain-containing protein [Rhizomicrobium sp.]|jgi:integrase|nr:integrase arm-type DNA-binding domain-containing protein [Rhizomicrobium sp.]
MAETSTKRRFTEQMVQRLNPPKAGRAEYADAVCPGLVLRVTDRGVKTFSVIYKVPGEGGVSQHGRLLRGRQHRITLGQWPVKGLSDARDEARGHMQEALAGRDPRPERRAQHLIRHSNTFEAVAKRYIDQHAKQELKNWKTVQSTFRLHVEPEWGNRPLRDIRRADVHALLDDLLEPDENDERRVGTAREVRKHLSTLFNWALDREIISENPAHKLRRDDLAKNAKAGRKLSDDELRAVWQGAAALEYPFGPMYQLLVLTGQRRGEWAGASRSEVKPESELRDKDLREAVGARERFVLEVPEARYKGGRDHLVPLSGQALALFTKLPEWKGNDYFLFSTRGGKVAVSGFSKAKADLDEEALAVLRNRTGDKKAELARYRVHDFRVTCESRLADLGFNQEIRDAVLGHAKVGLQKLYNKHEYFREKRQALEAYAEHVLAVVQ